MMGQTASQDQLFYAFNLTDHVPRDHLLRGIDRFLDLGELRQHLAPFYSHTGRPSIDPELMVRMLVVGYCMGSRLRRFTPRWIRQHLSQSLPLTGSEIRRDFTSKSQVRG